MTIVVFASCAKYQQVSNQEVWADIEALQLDVLLLLGDNVYLERDRHTDPVELVGDLRERYAAQNNEPHFAHLLAGIPTRGGKILAVWDDHDSFGNDRYGGDVSPEMVRLAREEFHRWLPFSSNRPEIYCRCDVGDISFLMLDVRSYRRAPAASHDDPNAVLGDRQWQWLEAELALPPKTYTVVCSGTTLYDYSRRGEGVQSESWEEYPQARGRLVSLLANRVGVLFLSGDIHDNELTDDDGVIEIVSSAVARKGFLGSGKVRANFGVLDVRADGVQVSLRGLQPRQRHEAWIGVNDWRLR